MIDRKQIAIDFAKSLNHPEIEKVILFGSVARGEDTEESDIDVLIITTDEDKIEDDVLDASIYLLLKTNEYISPMITNSKHYEKYKDTSFYSNVNEEGILIG